MTINKLTKRAAATVASFALAAGVLAAAGQSASATWAPDRTASTAVDTTYLTGTLGVPADTVIETVTYDRFQWLLKQAGKFAFLIGDPADTGFAANAVKVDTAAKAAGVAKVYWFNPNLSGLTGIRSLDIRNTANINLAANTRTIYGNIWKNVLGKNLGNGIKSVPTATTTNGVTTYSTTAVTISADDTVVNDAVNPLFDYRSTATPAVASTDDLFFTYNKDHVSGSDLDKIISWVDLSTNGSVDSALGTALSDAGSGFTQLSQFQWWKDSANTKHDAAYTDDTKYGGDILSDSDAANGWVIKQITYPELVHLLDVADSADKNFVILFGGTWCHNTRAVLKFVNQNAIENGVTTVYNFDLVLDGGTTNGTNGSANPIHVRAAANGGTPAAFNFRPSWAYGDVVRKYLKNLVTEYDPNTGTHVSYYPGGDTTAFPEVVRKLQVPFLINYQRGNGANPSATSIKRQWIQRNTDSSTGLANFREYMSEAWFTTPSAQLGLSFALPANATEEAALTDANKALLATARANVTFAQQALADLNVFFDGLPGAVVPTRAVTAPAVTFGAASTVTLRLTDLYGRTPTGTATLTIGGASYTATVADGVATFTTAALTPGTKDYSISYTTDAQIVGFTQTGTLVVTKAHVVAVNNLVTKAPTAKAVGALKVTVVQPTGLAAATGSIHLTLTKGAVTKTLDATIANGIATFVLPKLASGVWAIQSVYQGDANYLTENATVASVKIK